nr:hypothetical protein IKGEJPOP_00075 [Human alphaherpesvirus 3]
MVAPQTRGEVGSLFFFSLEGAARGLGPPPGVRRAPRNRGGLFSGGGSDQPARRPPAQTDRHFFHKNRSAFINNKQSARQWRSREKEGTPSPPTLRGAPPPAPSPHIVLVLGGRGRGQQLHLDRRAQTHPAVSQHTRGHRHDAHPKG